MPRASMLNDGTADWPLGSPPSYPQSADDKAVAAVAVIMCPAAPHHTSYDGHGDRRCLRALWLTFLFLAQVSEREKRAKEQKQAAKLKKQGKTTVRARCLSRPWV